VTVHFPEGRFRTFHEQIRQGLAKNLNRRLIALSSARSKLNAQCVLGMLTRLESLKSVFFLDPGKGISRLTRIFENRD